MTETETLRSELFEENRQLRARLAAAAALHTEAHYASLSGDGVTLDLHICDHDRKTWPCPTVRALAAFDAATVGQGQTETCPSCGEVSAKTLMCRACTLEQNQHDQEQP